MDAIGFGFITMGLTVLLLFIGISYLLRYRANKEIKLKAYGYRLLIAAAVTFFISFASCNAALNNLHC